MATFYHNRQWFEALGASRDILSVILAPRLGGPFNVVPTQTIDPPLLFCLDVRDLPLTPKQPARWMRAKLTLIRMDDGTEVTDPDIKTLRDIVQEKRDGWTWPEFVRPGQRLIDAEDDERYKIYFRFDGIRVPTMGCYSFQLKVEEDLGRIGAPHGPFKKRATIRTPRFECIAPSIERCSPATGDKAIVRTNPIWALELARADAIFRRLPGLRTGYDLDREARARAANAGKRVTIELDWEEEDSDGYM